MNHPNCTIFYSQTGARYWARVKTGHPIYWMGEHDPYISIPSGILNYGKRTFAVGKSSIHEP